MSKSDSRKIISHHQQGSVRKSLASSGDNFLDSVTQPDSHFIFQHDSGGSLASKKSHRAGLLRHFCANAPPEPWVSEFDQGQITFHKLYAGKWLGIERTSNLSVTCVRFRSRASTSQNFLLEVNLKLDISQTRKSSRKIKKFHWIFNENFKKSSFSKNSKNHFFHRKFSGKSRFQIFRFLIFLVDFSLKIQ